MHTTGGGVSERKIHCVKIEDLHYAWEDSGFVRKKRHSINLELLIILHLQTTSTSPCFFLALQQRFTAVEPHLFTSAPSADFMSFTTKSQTVAEKIT